MPSNQPNKFSIQNLDSWTALLVGGLIGVCISLPVFLALAWGMITNQNTLSDLLPGEDIPTATATWVEQILPTSPPAALVDTASPSPTETTASETAAMPTAGPTATPSATATMTATTAPDPWIAEQLSRMTLEEKIGQMLLIGVDGGEATAYNCGLVRRFRPGGIVYRGFNVVSPDQLRSLSAGLQNCAQQSGALPLWIALDHEGQYVHRFDFGAAIFPAAMAVGASGDTQNAYKAAMSSGQEIAYSGVNLVLGPDADVLTNYDNDVISLRSYGGDAQMVGEFVGQSVSGYQAAGIASTLKHFPGHGGVAGDTHLLLAVDQADLATLERDYLPPFRSGIQAGAPVVMFSHVAFPNIDGGITQPATVSSTLARILREQMGFQGFILSDSMGMGAIKNTFGNVGTASVKAVQAGVDMLLVTSADTTQSAYDSLLRAVRSNQIPMTRIDEAVGYILHARAAWGLKTFPQPSAPEPDWNTNRALAGEIAAQAVLVQRNAAGLIPIAQPAKRILVIGPEDGWGLYPALQNRLREAGHTSQLVTFSGPWNGPVLQTSYVQSLPAQAADYDLVLALTWEAHLNRLRHNDPFQKQLVNRLLQTGVPTIVVALKSPTDLLAYPDVSTFVATFGTTEGQIQGLADILVGRRQSVSVNPLPGLP